MTKIAIPTEDGVLSTDFAHARHFYIYELGQSGISTEEIINALKQDPSLLPRWLSEKGITDVIVNGIGRKEISRFYQYKINVFTGVPTKTPKELVTDYILGILETSDNTYDQ